MKSSEFLVCLGVFWSFLMFGQANEVNFVDSVKNCCNVCRSVIPENNKGLKVEEQYHKLHMFIDNGDLDRFLVEKQRAGSLLLFSSELQRYYLDHSEAHILFLKELYIEAKEKHERLIEKYKNLSHIVSYGIAVHDLASIYYELEEYEKAVEHYKLVWVNQNWIPDINSQAEITNNIGLVYLTDAYYNADSALFYQNKSLSINRQLNDSLGIATGLLNIGNAYSNEYEDAKAIAIWEEALGIAEPKGYKDILDELYYNLAFLHEEQGNLQAALAYRKLFEEVLEENWNRDRVWELAEKEKAYEVELRESRINGLEKEKKLQQAETERKQWQRNAFILLCLALGGLGLVIWRAYRSKKAVNKVISAKNDELSELNATKDQLFSIITHDLRSPVLSLKRSNQKLLMSLVERNHAQAIDIAQDNRSSLDNTFQLIENVLNWGVSQQKGYDVQFEKVHVRSLVQQMLYDYRSLAEEKAITIEENCNPTIFIRADLYSVKVVLRNVLDNAIKYNCKNGYIRLSCNRQHSEVRLKIENSGVSVPKEVQAKLNAGTNHVFKGGSGGIGLWLCDDMMKKNGGRIKLFSMDDGTRTCLYFNPFKDEKGQDIYSRRQPRRLRNSARRPANTGR